MLCLSRIKLEVLTTGQMSSTDTKTIHRITNLMNNCLLSDLAFSRTKARISQRQDCPNMMPLLAADGLLSGTIYIIIIIIIIINNLISCCSYMCYGD